jgi:GWxTD domain-containing protein
MTRQSDERTRSLRGARLFLALLPVGALAHAPAVGAPSEDAGALPWRVGGRVGFTVDAAAFPEGDSGYRLRVFIRIPPTTLRQIARDEQGAGRLTIQAKVRGSFGGQPREWQTDVDIVPGGADEALGKVASVTFETATGPQHLEVRVEDALSRKRGLIYMGREVRHSGVVQGTVEVPRPQASRDMSDIEFAWSESPGSLLPNGRSSRVFVPNSERLYGLLEPTLRATFVARSIEGDARPWHWVARVIDTADHVVAELDSVGEGSRTLDASLAMNLEGLPAGGYDLEVKAWQASDEGALTRRAHFSVAWLRESWFSNPLDIEDNVHFLLETTDEEEMFARLSPGEQERFLNDFWEKRDPDPERPGNAARETYLLRVAYANQNFTRPGLEKGMFSDRGRVFIRYGEPNEILQQVIPAGDETLSQMIQQLASEEDRSPEHLRQPGPGGDMRPFEVWIYTGDIPLPPDADPSLSHPPRRHRIVFLFVDDQGLGHYKLRYSTE